MRPKFGLGKRWRGMSASMPWRPGFLRCRGRQEQHTWIKARVRDEACIRKKSNITWNGAILILRGECAGS